MEAKEIGAIVDSMHEDELDVLSQLLSLSDPERSERLHLVQKIPWRFLEASAGLRRPLPVPKAPSYAKEALDRPGAELSAILREKAVILCREVFEKAMPFDLKEDYGEWHYGIFADISHQ